MIISISFIQVIFLLALAKFPPVLCCVTMTGIDLETMKQLLADQSKSFLSEMKGQVVIEVAAQLAPHAARLDQLHDDQTLLKKQLSDIANHLQQKETPNHVQLLPPHAALPPVSKPIPYYVPLNLSHPDIENIVIAKRTLIFSPIKSEDLERMKNNQAENVTTEDLMKRAVHEFLDVNMSIPTTTISRMQIKNISHSEEIDFNEVTVEFSDMCPVNTIFKFVRNLAPEHKISIFIPPVLTDKHEELKAHAFLLRNSLPRHRTVIKYIGNDLALYSKKPNDRSWLLVTSAPQAVPPSQLETTLKRPREEYSDSDPDYALNKPKRAVATTSDDGEAFEPDKSDNALAYKAKEKSTGIPKPLFQPVPCYSKPQPSPHHTPRGGFWHPDETRSPSSSKPSTASKNS